MAHGAVGMLVLAVALAGMPAAAGAITRDEARAKALSATRIERARPGTILFGLRSSLRVGTVIRETGRRPPRRGTRTRTMRRILTVRRERAYFFYLDRRAYQDYEHAGRVVLVGARTGRVTRSRSLRFAPAIDGRLPIFLRSREGYELPAYRVSTRPYAVAGATRAARASLGAFGGEPAASLRSAASESLAAARLAAERSCTVAIGARRSDELGTLGSASGSPVLPLLLYDPSRGSLASFVAREAIGARRCRDILFAITGDGYRRLSPPILRTSLSTRGSRMTEHHVDAATLRSIIAANPSVTFKLMVDGPGSGAYLEALRPLANVVLIATSSTASQTAFRYLPEKRIGGALRRNPLRRRADSSFFTTQLFGAAAFAASDAEVVHAAAEVAAGRAPSFLAYLVARAFQLSRPFDFTADLGQTQRLYTTFPVTPPGPLNRPPVAFAQSVTTSEDTPRAIALSASDPDGNPLTFTVGAPAHGTLSGAAPNLTYTPAANFNGTDSFTFSVSDGSLVSATVTVTITVMPVDDPPATSASGTLAYTENDPPTAIETAITITDIDSTTLTGARVTITGNHASPEDVLALPAQPTITGSYDSATGTLTLSGSATVAAYETALEAVTYANTSDAPSTATRTVTFQARDAGGFGAPGTHAITIAPVDDPPVAVDDSATVAEDASATAVAVLTNDTDVDGGPISIASATQPANGVVAVTGGGTGLTYAPDPAYCNDPPGTAPDTFTYTLTPGGATATVSVTVTCDDDPPTAVDDSATVAEDSGASAVDVLANDTDIDGGPIAVATVSDPANGTVVNNGTDVSYTPDADYCNSPPGTTPDTFTYTLAPGGSTATVSVSVTCVDDPPVAVDDSATVAEDSAANTIAVLANDTDVDGGPISVSSVSDPASGTTANNTTSVSYTPDPDYCNSPPGTLPDTFTYTLNGGSTATVSVLVTCVGDAPVVTNSATPLAYVENDPPTAVDPAVTVTDPDIGETITGATVQIGAGFAAGDVLALANAPTHAPIVALLVGDTLTLSGNATVPAYQAALRDVTYASTSDNPSTATRTLTFTVTDDDALAGSDTRDIQLTAVDDAPVAVDDSATVNEDSGANAIDVLANDTDVDGGTKLVLIASDGANGSVAITGGGTGLTYTPSLDYCNNPPGGAPDTFTYSLNGGSSATVSVTVNCQNDAPVLDTSAGTTSYTENAAPTPIDAALTVTDPDAGASITGATVQISANFAAGQDVLALGGVHPGISGVQAGDTLTLTGTATPAAYQAALRDVTYANSSEGPSTLLRTVTFTVTDDTALQGSDTKSLQVNAVNDPPTAVDDSGTTDEDTVLNVAAPGVLANDTDVDPGDTKTVVALNGSATLTQTLTSGASVTINADGSYSYDPQAAFQDLSTGQTDSDSFTYTMADGAGAQSTATVSITITGVSDAPTAVADTFDVIGNTGLFVGTTRPANQAGREITGSVLANDTDPDTPQASLVAEPVTNAPTTEGGTITIEADGNFTYHPDDLDTGVTDTFTYRVCDASPCNAATVANATGTLSLPIAGQAWYVRNNEPAGGDGTSDTPFDTLVEAEAASGASDTVFVFDGDDTTSNLDTGYVMDSGERLIGESRPLSVDPDGGGPLPASSLHPGTSGAQPTLTASNEDVVVLAANAVVDGVDLDPSGAGGGISGTAGTSAVTVSHVNVVDTGTAGTQPGIEMDGTTGVNRFSNTTVQNGGSASAIGVRINNAGAVLFLAAGTVTISTTGAKALDAAGTTLGSSQFDDITVTGSGSGAVRLSSIPFSSPSLGDGAGTDLSLETTSGATPALDISSANTVTVDGGGTDTISATGGPAADIRNSNGSYYEFDSVSSTNSAGDGINLDTNLTAPFVAGAGAISGAAGIAVDINQGGAGGGGFFYAGAINDGPGQTAEITNRDGGGATFTGNIADSADAGGGIVVAGNSDGSVTFSGASKVLSTGAQNAVSYTSNAPGVALSFQNGGLDIDATSGTGITASGNAGTIAVQGAGNTIDTTTGRALSLVNAPIAAADLTFERISANGAPNGIVLSNTGTAGGLTVSGNGGACATTADACTGGTIQATTGDAISLTTTRDTVLNRVKVVDNLGNGIRGAGVTNFALRDSVVDNNADDAATDEAGVHLTNLAGTADITRTLVANSPEDNARIVNASGTLSQLDVTDSTFRDTDTASPGNNGLLLQADGGSITADVLGSTFLRNRANGLQVVTNNNGSMNVEVDDSGTAQSTLDDNNIGVNIAHNSSGSFTYAVRDLTIDGIDVPAGTGGSASPINLNLAGAATSTMNGTVTGNTLTNSNSTTGPGIRVIGNGTATMTTLLDSNTISQVANRGIETIARDGSNTVNATITNNSVTLNNALAGDAIRVDSGAVSTDTTTICADIRGNTATTSAVGLFGIRVRQRFAGTAFVLEGYAGAPTDDTAVQAFLSSNNNSATTSADHGGAGFTTTASCPTPP